MHKINIPLIEKKKKTNLFNNTNNFLQFSIVFLVYYFSVFFVMQLFLLLFLLPCLSDLCICCIFSEKVLFQGLIKLLYAVANTFSSIFQKTMIWGNIVSENIGNISSRYRRNMPFLFAIVTQSLHNRRCDVQTRTTTRLSPRGDQSAIYLFGSFFPRRQMHILFSIVSPRRQLVLGHTHSIKSSIDIV